MKPFSIVLSLVLGLGALALIVWVGRFGGALPVSTSTSPETNPSEAKPAEEIPLPKSGPFGKAEVTESEFNFGVKNVGDTDEHVFSIKNVGEGVLRFEMGKPTCQCTLGEITKNGEAVEKKGELAPGESISILVKWVMKNQMEKFRQTVPVMTDDPDQRKIELAITGMVDQAVRIFPEGQWDFGDMSLTEPSTAEGYIGSKSLTGFTIQEMPRDNARAKITWEPADEETLAPHQAKSGYKIKVEAGPDVPIGRFRETIRLQIIPTDSSQPNDDLFVNFGVIGRRGGPIEIRGVNGANFNVDYNRLHFGEFPASSGKKAKVTFFVKNFDEELVLQAVEPSDSRIKFTFPEKGKVFGKSKSYQADVEILPGPPGKHRDNDAKSFKLKFNHPEAPDFNLTIDYHAT
ncbi:DUF1573 domain-containing protein [Schlesneria sp. DSM 10557]|uniref:DUF1573 domain-containing protein n=1 Tax=Schlesneria sp. DSM 10557 TaxID=3044399 RepID=UPI0035A18847